MILSTTALFLTYLLNVETVVEMHRYGLLAWRGMWPMQLLVLITVGNAWTINTWTWPTCELGLLCIDVVPSGEEPVSGLLRGCGGLAGAGLRSLLRRQKFGSPRIARIIELHTVK